MMLLGDINQPSLLISTALTVSARERRRDTRADTDGRHVSGRVDRYESTSPNVSANAVTRRPSSNESQNSSLLALPV